MKSHPRGYRPDSSCRSSDGPSRGASRWAAGQLADGHPSSADVARGHADEHDHAEQRIAHEARALARANGSPPVPGAVARCYPGSATMNSGRDRGRRQRPSGAGAGVTRPRRDAGANPTTPAPNRRQAVRRDDGRRRSALRQDAHRLVALERGHDRGAARGRR